MEEQVKHEKAVRAEDITAATLRILGKKAQEEAPMSEEAAAKEARRPLIGRNLPRNGEVYPLFHFAHAEKPRWEEKAPAVEETPAEVTSAEEVLAEETPAEEVPTEEVLAEEAPVESEEIPAEEVPTEEVLAEEAPVEPEEVSAEEVPTEEVLAEEAPVEPEEVPAEEVPTEEVLAEEAPVEPEEVPAEAPAEETLAEVSEEPEAEAEEPLEDLFTADPDPLEEGPFAVSSEEPAPETAEEAAFSEPETELQTEAPEENG